MRDGEGEQAERVERIFDAVAAAYGRHAVGGRGAIGDSGKARAAIAAMDPDDDADAVERAPRWLRSLRDAKRNYTPSVETYCRNREFVHHPPPKLSAGAVEERVIGAYSIEAWAMFWKRIVLNEERPTKEARDRIGFALERVPRGLTTVASAVPPQEDQAALTAVQLDSPEHVAWCDWATRVGIRLPRPDQVRVIFAPAGGPPPLRLTWKGYPLAAEFHTSVRSKIWWWRLYSEGASPRELIDQARRNMGTLPLTFGPLPLAAELDAMIEIDRINTPNQFDHWESWFRGHDAPLNFFGGSIFVPSEYPPHTTGVSARETATA
jgi:hypothetical protein